MAKRAVVTGAAGFIGSHLCEALIAEGYSVVGIDALTDNYDVAIKKLNLEALTTKPGFEFVQASVNDLKLDTHLQNTDVLFHLSAQPGVRQSWHEKFDDYIDANVRATHRICEAARRCQVPRIVYASSSSVYGETAALPMKEDHPTVPMSPYGVTKLAGESLCRLYRQNFGLPVVCLRYFTVYGPRQRADMAFHIFIARALDGKPIEVFGNGEQTRDFTFVSDIVAANLAAMSYEGDAVVFNVGGGSRVTLNTAMDALIEALGKDADLRYVDRVAGDVTHTYADISLAQRELEYAPSVSLEEGLAQEVAWVRRTRERLNATGGPK